MQVLTIGQQAHLDLYFNKSKPGINHFLISDIEVRIWNVRVYLAEWLQHAQNMI